MAHTEGHQDFFDRVNRTKNALVAEWNKNDRTFIDKNYLQEPGLLPEGIGLVSVLLMLVAFGEDERIFPKNAKAEDATLKDMEDLINASFSKLLDWTEDGFTAYPILDSDADIFNNECGYSESVTWCLSAAILALYAQKKGYLTLDVDVTAGVLNMMPKAFKALLDGQREDGTWGFTTDGKGKPSLYYTYAASATLADFFDYVMDEIVLLEADKSMENAEPMADVLRKLDTDLGIDVGTAAKEARLKLDKFLIENCLPLLPKLAACGEMSAEELRSIGGNTVAPYEIRKGDEVVEKKWFHNLYYTYYIMDMMITASADGYFKSIAENKEAREALLEKYSPLLTDHEIDYYEDEETFAELFTNFYEQALHSSRMNYLSASRTGSDFWDIDKSELPVEWEHEDRKFQSKARQALNATRAEIKDPTILPMSLRANIMYSFYVTEKPEITIERLFSDICENTHSKASDRNHAQDLWDSTRYNLMITERSIESVIDYYDYLNRYEFSGVTAAVQAPSKPAAVAEKTAFEKAMDEKIADYLQSDEGQALIDAAIAKKLAAAPTAGTALGAESLTSLIALVNKKDRRQFEKEGDEFDDLMCELVALGNKITQCNVHRLLSEKSDGSENVRKAEMLFRQMEALLAVVAEDDRLLKDQRFLPLIYDFLADEYTENSGK